MGRSRFRPQFATALGFSPVYFFDRPQQVFGPAGFTPPPAISDFEVAEQTTGVFDNIIHNDETAPNQIVVTQT